MNLHEIYLAAQLASKGGGNSTPIDTQVNGVSENAVQNKAIYDFVNSSVANNTAYFKGTYNSIAELETVVDVTNNDYAFVVSTDIFGNTIYNRYKYNGNEWVFEYALNNSSFTANQWNTINSGITSDDIQNLQDGKVDKVTGKGLSTNDFTDADKSKFDSLENYDDAEIKADVAELASQAAINKSTLGYQRKNLLKLTATTKTVNGVTYTVNADGSITANGTATANAQITISDINLTIGESYTLTGCPTGGSSETYRLYGLETETWTGAGSDTGDGVTFTAKKSPTAYRIVVFAGKTVTNLTFYPMLRYAEITDNTFEPYHPSVKEQIDSLTDHVDTDIAKTTEQAALNQSTLGYRKKNILKCTAVTQTISGITFTVNNDLVNAAGTVTKAFTYYYAQMSIPISFDKDVIITYTGSISGCILAIQTGEVGEYKYTNITGNSYKLSKGTKLNQVYLQQNTVGTIVSIADFGVMIRYADISNDTYEPYKPSVEERLAALEEKFAALEGGNT